MDPNPRVGRGPFRVAHLRDSDPYELSNGHALHCVPSCPHVLVPS